MKKTFRSHFHFQTTRLFVVALFAAAVLLALPFVTKFALFHASIVLSQVPSPQCMGGVNCTPDQIAQGDGQSQIPPVPTPTIYNATRSSIGERNNEVVVDSNNEVVRASANAFLDSVGINEGSLGDAVGTQMKYIGARVMRGINIPKQLHLGIKGIVFTGSASGCPGEGESASDGTVKTNFDDTVAQARDAANAGVLIGIEGANEPNNWAVCYPPGSSNKYGGQGGSWLGVAELQRDLYNAIKADPVTKNYPVFSPTAVGAEDQNYGLQCLRLDGSCPGASSVTLMPQGTVYADAATDHNYLIAEGGTWSPADNQAWNNADPLGSFKDNFGSTWVGKYAGYTDAQLSSIPRISTESGWWNDGSGDGIKRIQAAEVSNAYLSQFKRGWKYTLSYTLTDNNGETCPTPGFSWYSCDDPLQPMPVAVWVHNMTTILADDKNVSTNISDLAYSIPNKPATVHDLLLQKSNGQHMLVVWDEHPSAGAKSANAGATDNVTVQFESTHSTINVYDISVGTNLVLTYSNVSSVPLTLSDHAMILEVLQ